MAATGRTQVSGLEQEQPGSIGRALLNTATAGSAVIAKLIAGSGLLMSSTGADAGTGDVTLYTTTANPIDNAEMRVAQRGASLTNVASGANAPALTLDRWIAYRTGFVAGLNVSQVVGPTGFANAMRLQRASSDTSTATVAAVQILESSECARFAGQTVTLSCTLRAGANFSPSGGNLNLQIVSGTGTDEGRAKLYSGWTGAATMISGSIAATTTAQRVSAVLTVPANATELALGLYFAPAGTAGSADYVDMTGWQIEVGGGAGPFLREPIAAAIARCQRHYRTGSVRFDGYSSAASQVHGTPEDFQVQMRVAPTLTQTSTSATNCSTTVGNANVTAQGLNDTRSASAAGAVSWTTSYTASADL